MDTQVASPHSRPQCGPLCAMPPSALLAPTSHCGPALRGGAAHCGRGTGPHCGRGVRTAVRMRPARCFFTIRSADDPHCG